MHPTRIGPYRRSHLWSRLSILFISAILVTAISGASSPLPAVYARDDARSALQSLPGANPADPRVEEQIEQAWHPAYLSLATGDPQLLDHGVYAWPFDLNSIGWSMQSYQDYGGAPYFHHGMDMMKMWGTNVYNRSGGQVINIENYQPGWDLYWEVAILDPYGYIWQYHHIDSLTIPLLIWDKFHEWQQDPINGGFIPTDTYIGDIIQWPVWSYYDYFNHVHLNILAAGGVFVNGFEFHDPLPDTVGPEIQGVGLLQNGQVLPGNQVEGSYGLYVHARDLILDQYYYLPPWEISFSVDGGPEHITWRFDTLPGGASDTLYLNDFYVVPPTCGDYECRDYYIDLGFIPDSQFEFPATGGEHTVMVTVRDYAGNSISQPYTYTVIGPPAGTLVWQDDFETNKGWVPNPDGTDTATSGMWERGDPQGTNSGGPKQLGTTPSGLNDLVTGRLAGSSATSNDVDGGVTSIRSPEINLRMADSLTLSFRYYLAHGTNATAADYLRITVTGSTPAMVFEELGAANNDDGVWAISNVSLDEFIGQKIHLDVTAADADDESLVEAAIDNVMIVGSGVNQAPTADPQAVTTLEDTPVDILLTGSDPEGDLITYTIAASSTHGQLSGIAPNLTYTPEADYNGADSFTFMVSDRYGDSEPAQVAIDVSPVNDAPLATSQAINVWQSAPTPITLSGSDVDGDPLTFSLVDPPVHGSLSGNPPNLVYTPAPGYRGPDGFSFIASDGILNSPHAKVNLTIIPHSIYAPLIHR